MRVTKASAQKNRDSNPWGVLCCKRIMRRTCTGKLMRKTFLCLKCHEVKVMVLP